MILIVLLYALWAASVTAAKMILGYTKPMFLTGIRMFISGIFLLGYQYFSTTQEFLFKKKHIYLYAQIIILGIFVTYNLRFWALDDLPTAKAMFLYNLSPFFSALYSYFLFNEKITRTQWAGLLIGFVGMIPILLTTSTLEKALGELFFISWQECAVIVSVATHSYSWIVMRKLVKDKNYSPMMVNGICMFAGGTLSLITSLFIEGLNPVSNPIPFWSLLAFIIVISNIICHNLYGYLLKEYSATLLSFAGFMAPPFAAVYGWMLFGERMSWHFYVSSIIVFIGLFLFYKDELKLNTQVFDPESPQ